MGEGNGNPLQCSCLENPRDRGAWWAAVYGVAQSQTRLSSSSSRDGEMRSSSPPSPGGTVVLSPKAGGGLSRKELVGKAGGWECGGYFQAECYSCKAISAYKDGDE
ncbi:unnamed protein product [Rangifer tarandus platyrhynchus]|uniref:Uncharacterized protein n=2 Tax=Rangifer tarandus platyrhynchus TaxID=3082113 RepID=A0AC60A9I7_RANTA|nr:unnamed protein product [Rangifer tarandus platyrhynchus]